MATYKLIQDIEAEDKILGPLTLRQFIFALIAIFFGYLCFVAITKNVLFLLIIFLPPAVFFGFFAFPFGKDQPTEIWFLAKLRFWFLPRKRIWDQAGVKELVTITVPKKVEQVLTDGLSQNEVKSRLQVLANTLDTRGWAIKNISNMGQPVTVTVGSDRLIDLNSVPQDVPAYDVSPSSDILDVVNNPVAQKVDAMVTQSAKAHRQKLMEEMRMVDQPANNSSSGGWFMGGSGASSIPAASQPAPPTDVPISSDEAQLSKELKQRNSSRQMAYGHLKTVRPAKDEAEQTVPVPAVQGKQNTTPTDKSPQKDDSDILNLARNDDLNVATLAREVHKKNKDGNSSSDEVVISLR